MKKSIYKWIWRWHFIGGIVSLPVVILLSITGSIYLFKDDYEKSQIDEITKVSFANDSLSYQQQWEIVQDMWNKNPEAMIINRKSSQATEFISGRFSHKSSFYIDPYSGKETGRIEESKTDMHKIRKLHGELLLGSFGTKIVELVASWMVVLLITGIYLFFPLNLKSLFRVRTKLSKRVFYRDFHAVIGFWFSLVLVLVLAGGLPWTDVFGSGYKWVQNSTNSGFPSSWNGKSILSRKEGKSLPLDVFVNKANQMELNGVVSVHLPKSPKGVFSISNSPSKPTDMKMFHFDQYSGELLKSHNWEDIGIMMKTRLWVMAFHQGQLGTWNFYLMLITSVALTVLSLSALVSYLERKTKGNWDIPTSPKNINFGAGLLVLLTILSVSLPLFGLSVILLFIFDKLRIKFKPKLSDSMKR